MSRCCKRGENLNFATPGDPILKIATPGCKMKSFCNTGPNPTKMTNSKGTQSYVLHGETKLISNLQVNIFKKNIGRIGLFATFVANTWRLAKFFVRSKIS